MVGLTPEERDFLNLLQHEDAAANLSQAVAWCIDSCMKIEKLYGIDACYVAYNDIRKPENDPTLAAGHQHSPPSPATEGIKWVCPECGRIYDSKPASCSFCNSGPTFTAEGKEELDRLESFNREEVKNILMEFSYDFQQEKYGGCSTHRHIVSLFIKVHRELFSTPTPPAGAEGEREVPEEIHELVEQLWIKNGRTGSANGSFTNGASAMWRKMQEQAIAKNKKIFSLRERLRIIISNSEEFDRDYANCRQELSAARTTIAELEAKVKDLQDWIHSHQ